MFFGLYDEDKAAQSVAYLLHRAGGRLDLLKLTKLCYLAERRSYEKFGEPLTGDGLVSMNHGPVLSYTYDGTKVAQPGGVWSAWLKGREGNAIVALEALHDLDENLDALSRGDLCVLDETWNEFGDMTAWELRNWTHAHCPEWEDPAGSSAKIEGQALFAGLGFSAEVSEHRLEVLKDAARLRRTLAVS